MTATPGPGPRAERARTTPPRPDAPLALARARIAEAVGALRDAGGDEARTLATRLERVARALTDGGGTERARVTVGAVRELGAVLRSLPGDAGEHPVVVPLAAAIKALAPVCPDEEERSGIRPAGAERRASARVPIRAEVGFDTETHFYRGFTEDLSAGGLFVATYDPLPVGSRVTVSFVLPDGHAVEAAGRVEWVRDPPDLSLSPGLGIRFETLGADDERSIRGFLEAREPIFYDV